MISADQIITILVAMLSGGGVGAIITALVSKSKNDNDISKSNIGVALKLRDEAVEQYTTANEKLLQAQRLLQDVQVELSRAKSYITSLQCILDENGIPYEPFG